MEKKVIVAVVPLIVLLMVGSIVVAWQSGFMPEIPVGVVEDDRFVEVFEEEDLDAWIAGHIHSDHQREETTVEKWDTFFADAGSIEADETDRYAESLYMIFENGSREVTVKSRNHTLEEWNHELEDDYSFELGEPFEYEEENLKVWVKCDIQAVTEKEWDIYENSIYDANEVMDPDFSLILGDLVDHGAEEEFERFLEYLEKTMLPLENHYALAGNHDFGPSYFTGDLANYEEYIVEKTATKEKLTYSIERGNLQFLILSDERPGVGGYISDESFEWWREEIEEAPEDLNQITLAHHPIEGTVAGSEIEDYVLSMNLVFAIIGLIILMGIGALIGHRVSKLK